VAFDSAVIEIMRLEGLDLASATLSTTGKSNGPQAAPKVIAGQVLAQAQRTGMTVMEVMSMHQAVAAGRDKLPSVTQVLAAVHQALEDELMPVVLSSVNKDMRDIQANSQQYFALPSSSSTSTNAGVTGGGGLTGIRGGGAADVTAAAAASNKTDLSNVPTSTVNAPPQLLRNRAAAGGQRDIPLCLATRTCIKTARPLFTYWLQLPTRQHREMLGTVIDRLLRGFAAAAREELEAMTYRLLTGDDKVKKVCVCVSVHTIIGVSLYLCCFRLYSIR
jgi:hypothetical protein